MRLYSVCCLFICLHVFFFLQQNIRSEEVTGYADLDVVLEDIRAYRSSHGFPPTMEDCFSYLDRLDAKIVKPDVLSVLFQEILKQQNSHITLPVLLKIVRAKQQSLHDYVIRYEVIRGSQKDPGETTMYEFAAKKNHFLLDTRRKNGNASTQDRMAYNGEDFITFRTETGLLDQGSVAPASHLEIFFHSWMPLIMSGLFDSKTCDTPDYYYDLALFFEGVPFDLPGGTKIRATPDVFEKIELIDGCRCIAISDFSTTKYLDMDRDYSLIQSDFFVQTRLDSSQGEDLVGRALSLRTKFYDLKSFENGVWLPTRIESVSFNDNKEIEQINKVFVTSVEINQGIDDSFFTDFIPDGTLVADAKTGLVYRQGDHASIDALLKETAVSKRVWIFKYISMALGLAMIIFALVAKYLAYRKRKNDP